MRPKKPLPDEFDGRAFRAADALAAGVSPGHLRSATVPGPHHGLRAAEEVQSAREADLAYGAAAPAVAALASVSACRVWGIPLPLSIERRIHTYVAVPTPRYVPRGKAITGIKLAEHLFSTRRVDGVRILSPCVAWAQAAEMLGPREVLVQADALLTVAGNYPGRRFEGALATLEQLRAITEAWAGRAGVGAMRAALEIVRAGSESPGESRLRHSMLLAGFPEPEMQIWVLENGHLVARVDLAYSRLKIAIEYDGDHHFDKQKAIEDVERRRELERLGWIVIQVTRRDIRDPTRLFASLRAAMKARGF